MPSPSEKSAAGRCDSESPPVGPSAAASVPPRKASNSPCCGKRPRTPRSEELLAIANSAASLEGIELEDYCGESSSSSSSSSSPSKQQQQQHHLLRSVSSFDRQEEEGDPKRADEPCNKIRRSSPTPSEDEDDELLQINEQQQEQEASKEEDSKPPAILLDSTQEHSESDNSSSKRPPAPLPLAPSLKDYMKPGATSRFRPRPEWYTATPHRKNGRRRRQTNSSSRTSFPAERFERFEIPELSVLERIGAPANPAAAASLRAGLMVAPANGLLQDGFFDFFDDSSTLSHSAPSHNMAAAIDHDSGRVIQQESSEESQLLSLLGFPSLKSQDSAEDSVPPPSTFGRDCDPALHVTVRENATEAALALLEWGAPIEAENAKGITPLILASQKGNVRLVQELLRRGGLPSHSSANGTTTVMQACHFGNLDCLEVLLGAGGVSLMEMANFNHTTPLMRAAQEGNVQIVETLLQRGASVNRRNRVQMTALMLASQRGHADVCRALVRKGAELDSMTAQNSTSLLLACKRGHVDVVRALITAGCELWVQDSRGRCAREIAQRRELKDLIPLLDANVQLFFMQRQQRKQRSYDMIILWNLLQRERAMIPINSVDDAQPRQVTIHQMVEELQPKKVSLSMHPQTLPPTLPYHLSQKSTQALLRTMTLPAPLVELISKYIPMPPMWERRVGMLTKRSVINADATVACALDLVDEILEEGGFVEACDFAKVTAPTHFASWRDWRVYCRLRCRRGGPVVLPHDHPRVRPGATTASVPMPSGPPAVVEMRRQVGFLQILANRTPLLAHVLGSPPYNLPRPLIQQLITTSDIQSLVRRMGSRGVHFEATVAMDLIMLVSRLLSWYSSAREDEPYPINPTVVHPPLPQRRHRPLPLRVPMVTLTGAQLQYRPQSLPYQQHAETGRQRPSAPGPDI